MEQLSSEETAFLPPGPEHRPRPEAVALGWKDMLDNTRKATGELIDWLIAAIRVSESKKTFTSHSPGLLKEQLSTSVLIAGDRGFGKTTVLLSAATAFQRPEEFIPEPRDGATWDESERRLRTKIDGSSKSIVWLDPLDMEPLPPDANLLATLLVRVQNALRPDRGAQEKRTDSATSSALLVEEALDEPWAKIEPLVRHASFMWENNPPAQGESAREHAANQVKAADIYATFQKDFFEAIDSVARYKFKRSFGSEGKDKHVILVLPIDNVDRSIQHLSRIIKLIRMVASPRLWFLLAAGREEFQLFLERTFQQELSEAGQPVQGESARDASMAIARRQAAGALRRILPSIHRIEIEPLSPRKIWEFKAPQSITGPLRDTRCIRDLLRELKLPQGSTPNDRLETFSDLFDVRERLTVPGEEEGRRLVDEYVQVLKEQGDYEEDRPPPASSQQGRWRALLELRARLEARGDKTLLEEELLLAVQDEPREEPPLFSLAARLALCMSARTSVDFWQEARRAVQKQARDVGQKERVNARSGEEAIELAHRMLCMAIDESDLPSWASEQLLHRILRKDAQRRVFLDLTSEPVSRLKLTTLSDVLEWPRPDGTTEGRALRSELCLRHVMDVILMLKDTEVPGRITHLPSNVAGWYMLLHDLLALTADGRMLTQRITPFDVTPQLVVTRHEARMPRNQIVELGFRWMLPEWETFIDSFLFTMQWKAFLHRIRGLFITAPGAGLADARAKPDDAHFRLILAAWVDCVCAVAGENRGWWDWTSLNRAIRGEAPARINVQGGNGSGGTLGEYERQVAKNARTLFEQTYDDLIRFGRATTTRRWLETFLPMLRHPEFLPPSARGLHEQIGQETGEAGDVPLLRAEWSRYEPLVLQRRRALVRAEMMMSPAYAQMKELYRGETGRGARECGRWLEKACETWFEVHERPGAGGSE